MAKPNTKKQPPTHHHASRYRVLCEAFLRHLDRYLPGFKREFKDYPDRRWHMGNMIIEATTKYRAHSHVEGHARYTHTELDGWFGRGGFIFINERLGIFELERDDKGRHAWSKVNGRTRAFKLTPKVDELRTHFLKGCFRRRPTRLISEDGKYLQTMPASALDAKNRGDHQTRRGFKGLDLPAAVPVNLVQLRKLIEDVEARLYAREAGILQGEIFSRVPAVGFLRELGRQARMLVAMARNDVCPDQVPHRYFESEMGRIYADGAINLTVCFRAVRQAALAGLYDIDIENCHYTLLAQMAEQHGHKCAAIQHYLDNKKQVRRALVAEFGITEDQAKQALIALIFGARFSVEEKHALPKLLKSPDLARRLYEHPQFRALRDDIAEARRIVLAAQKPSRGVIKNIRGLTISADEDPKRRLAHLLQGLEAAALEAAFRLYPADIVLLQHDGFSATRPLDTAAIEAAMLEATGYRLKVEQEVIQVDLASPFNKHAEGIVDAEHEALPRGDVTKTPSAGFLNGSNHLRQFSPPSM
jgi:hypothetical protein